VAEIKSSTVDKVAEKIKQSNPSMSSEQARKIARDGAERVNRQSRERGK
jgi:hypothetical protein